MQRYRKAVVASAIACLPLSMLATPAGAQIEEIVVTAQKRAQSAQDVPISVSAFDAAALEARQIDTFSDLQFNVPNVSYSKGNFSGDNFQIRGIGTLLTAQSADSGVAMHVNDVYLNAPRIFETEYYDMEQVEILRGPQGTLFGRNATGGAVNLKTARPDIGELYADIQGELGNFEHRKLKGAINIPISDRIAGRLAGIIVDRDGYTKNVLTGDSVDDREQYSVRGSLRFDIADGTRLDLIGHVFNEDSTRTRSQKQLCSQDPSAILGCIPDGIPTESINPFATAGTLLSSNLLLGPLGVFDFFSFAGSLDPTAGNPSDLRKVRMEFAPEYESEENFLMAELTHDLTDTLTFTGLLAMQDTKVRSRQDYNGTAGDAGVAVVPAGFCAFSPAACAYFGTSDGGPLWVGTVPDPDSSLGAIGGAGEFDLSPIGGGRDLSLTEAEQWSTELRLASSFDGPVNFLLAGYYMAFESEGDYFVQAPGLDYPAIVLANGALAGNPGAFVSLAPGYFHSETDLFELDSLGIFGELYYDLNETMKLTLGLRFTKDEKFVRDRQKFLNVPVLVGVDGSTSYVGSDGSFTPIADVNQLLAAAAADGGCVDDLGNLEPCFDADPNVAGGQIYREDSISFEEWTGRIVFDWMPDVAFTDDTLVYVSYGRGYKGGGINPPIDTNLFPNTPTSFAPEKINAFEIGTKNTFWNRLAQANLSVFYYDYGDLQIGKIINRTSVNENTDADIYGAELEVLVAPTDGWLLNGSLSYLKTKLGETETVDPRDPTQGRQDVTLIKDFVDASNCVVVHNGQGALSDNAAFVGTVTGAGAPYLPTGRDLGGVTIPATPGVSDSAFSSCAAMQAIAPLFGYTYLDSVQTNLKGNELLQAPQWTVSLGAQYTHFLGNGMSLVGRVDYYWQDDFYSTTFNRPQDRIEAWDIWNAQVTLNGRDDRWYAKAFVQNIGDKDHIVGTYQTDPSSGLFTNAFLVEPRLYGLTLGVSM
ncbi:MAG: TonB-dependent receptor [Pseudomonadales bacterium]|nr:TonB-dependent receptor [Pseudomonadales bacterium]